MASYQTIKDWPEADRPREKLLAKGSHSLTETDCSRSSCATATPAPARARSITRGCCSINSAGSKASRMRRRAKFPRQRHRSGESRANQSLPGDRQENRQPKVGDRPAASLSRRCVPSLPRESRREKREFFYVVLLNNKNRKIREVKISEGSLTASLVHPREVFNPVIRESAAAVIFVHNHPSGDPAPSPEDIDITRRLKEVGDVMGVRVSITWYRP